MEGRLRNDILRPDRLLEAINIRDEQCNSIIQVCEWTIRENEDGSDRASEPHPSLSDKA